MWRVFLILFFSCTAFASATGQAAITWQALDSTAAHMPWKVYSRADDRDLRMWYMLPPQAAAGRRYPAIVLIHGGAWQGGSASTLAAYAAYFASRGMVGITIEYRLMAPGSGSVSRCIEDCNAALKYIKIHADDLQIDLQQVVLSGESAGGHLALCTQILHDGEAPPVTARALVLLNPVVNLATPVFYKFLDSSLLGPGVKLPDTATLAARYTQKARALSPLYSLHKALAPILLINGLDDKITPAADAQYFADSARRYGTAVELQWLKETGHAFAVPHYKASEAQVVQTALAMDAWLVKAGLLQGKPILVHGADPNWIKR